MVPLRIKTIILFEVSPMNRINQSEIEEVIRRAQRGENLDRRRKRAESLDEYFRRRNALMRRVGLPPSQPVSGVPGGSLPAPDATQLSGRTAVGLADSSPQVNTRLEPEVRTGVFVSLPELGGSGTPPAGAESIAPSYSAPVPKPKKRRRV